MPGTSNGLLDALLDSWDRNNTIPVNLLRALPENGLDAKAIEDSPSVARLFRHIIYVRRVFVSEDAPEFAAPVPEKEWAVERDRDRIAQMLNHLALKAAGTPFDDEEIGDVTWDVWMRKS